MENGKVKLLFVEDNKSDRILFQRFVKKEGLPYDCMVSDSVSSAKPALEKNAFDIVLTDYDLGDSTAFDLLGSIPENMPVVIITGTGCEEIAVKALKMGVSDYLIKDPEGYYLKTLSITVEKAIKAKAAELALKEYQERLEEMVKEKTDQLEDTVAKLKKEIEERKQAEDTLRKSQAKYSTLVENSLDGIAVTQKGKIKFFNRVSMNIVGYKPEELVGMNILDLVAPEYQKDIVKQHLERQSGKDVPAVSETALIGKHHAIVPVEVSITGNMDYEGKSAELVVIRDISARIEAQRERDKFEAQFQQAQKMEAMGTLAGGIAHDFNNLLMAVQGRTSLLLADRDSSHPDFEHLGEIQACVESAADLTGQLLGFARGGKYEVRPTDLNKLIKKENRMFGRTRKEITIHGKYQKDLWSAEVDRGQIDQVLLNLYVNAWQAMPGGGDLYLKTKNVTLDENDAKAFFIETGRYVKISVADTGVGMDKATRERIFEPFFTTKEIGRGTGLGLASVYGIIKNHGGFINVYSEKGHGTTFNIYLPASKKEGTIEGRKAAGDTLRGSETVLFVDDEDMITEVAEEWLKQLGYKVLIAGGGKKAIEIYEKNRARIDLVILDMIMPNMGGGDIYDRLKDMDAEVKVLLASGYSVDGQATEILDRGCNGFIQKPFKMKELSQKLREILDGR